MDGAEIVILVGDFFDDKLYSALQMLGGVTAIACWLIGASPDIIAEHMQMETQRFDGPELASYRLKLQACAYELGRQLLSQSEIVHIVDRSGIGQWSDKNAARAEVSNIYMVALAGFLFARVKGTTEVAVAKCARRLRTSSA